MAYRGKYKLKNPAKYKGDPNKIVWRSLWELKFCKYCDFNSSVLKWSSEEIVIPYRSPVDNKRHRYFPDFVVELKNKAGETEILLIEVKPKKQTAPPKLSKSGKKTKRFFSEAKKWGVNSAKWEAAERHCEEQGWKFVILTENELRP